MSKDRFKKSCLSVYETFINPFSDCGNEKTDRERLAEVAMLNIIVGLTTGEIRPHTVDTLQDALERGIEKNGLDWDELVEELR